MEATLPPAPQLDNNDMMFNGSEDEVETQPPLEHENREIHSKVATLQDNVTEIQQDVTKLTGRMDTVETMRPADIRPHANPSVEVNPTEQKQETDNDTFADNFM